MPQSRLRGRAKHVHGDVTPDSDHGLTEAPPLRAFFLGLGRLDVRFDQGEKLGVRGIRRSRWPPATIWSPFSVIWKKPPVPIAPDCPFNVAAAHEMILGLPVGPSPSRV